MSRLLPFTFVALVSLAWSGCQTPTPTVPAPPPPGSPTKFRLETRPGREERLVTEIRINGLTAQLALDTGAGEHVILFAPSLARLRLDITRPVPPDPTPVPGRAQLGVIAPVDVELFGRVFLRTPLPFVAVPPGISTENHVDGVIGWPAIADGRWDFSLGDTPPSAGKISRLPTDLAGWTRFSVAPGTTLSLRFTDAGPLAPRLMIDTGNDDGVLLAPAAWRAWLAAHPYARRTMHAAVIYGQPVKVHEGAWADEINIHGLQFRGVPVREADPAYLRDAAPGEDIVVLGLAALKRLDLILDGTTRTAHAKPSITPPPRSQPNRTTVPASRSP